MFINSGYATGTRPQTWQDKFEELKKARTEYAQYYVMMTPWERTIIGKEIRELHEANEKEILDGAFGEYRQAIDSVNSAVAGVERARAKERTRWDAEKLNAEMQVVKTLVTTAINSPTGMSNRPDMKQLKKIYEDFYESGDMHKQRAAAEVFQSLVSMVGHGDLELGFRANELAEHARRDAEKCRSFPELDEAIKNVDKAGDDFNSKKTMLLNVDRGLGYTNPNDTPGNSRIISELATTKINNDGTITKYEQIGDMP